MALRKPSDFFNKKETTGVFNSPEVSTEIMETYDRFRDNFDKVNNLSEKVEQLSQQLSEKLNKSDLENAMLSQLMILDENFKSLQNQVKGLNKEDIREFKTTVSSLVEIVDEIVENKLPKYKKQITNNEIRIGEKFDSFKEVVEENILDIRNKVDNKVNNIVEIFDQNLEYFNQQFQENFTEVKKTTDTYNKLSKSLEKKVEEENKTLEEYSQVIQSLCEAFVELETSLEEETSSHLQVIEEKFESISSDMDQKIDSISEEVKTLESDVSLKISSIKVDVVINEQHIKNIDKYLKENHQELLNLKEEIFAEIEKLPLGNVQENVRKLEKKLEYIEEVYKNIEPEVIVKEVIQEGLLNEPPETKNSDSLTPLNQNFVTLDQLQEHYRLFINRIQQQLATLGGGGETQLKYLDDIVGIATNPSAYDGKFLKYNHSLGKFEFVTVSAGGGGGSQTLDDTLQLGNTSSLGMSVGIVTASSFVKTSGTSSEFLKADGSVDTNSYATETYVSLATVGLASVSYVDTQIGLSTFGLASTTYVNNAIVGFTTSGDLVGFITSGALIGYTTEGYVINQVGLSTIGLASTDYVNTQIGLSTSGLVSVSYVDTQIGLATTGLLSSTGDGSSLTGIVTYIAAGSGINLSANSGYVTISATGIGTTGSFTQLNSDWNAITGITSILNKPEIVSQIIAGAGITISPTQGTGVVTINAIGIDTSIYATETYVGLATIGLASTTYVNSAIVGFITSGSLSGYATEGYVNTQIGLATSGLLNSTGNGSSLTGIVTYIEAGSGISIDQSTGKVTITSTGGGGSGTVGLTIEDEGGTVGTANSVTSINFIGENVTAIASGTISTITVATQTYVETSGISSYSILSGIATYATTTGVSTSVIGGISSVTQLQVTGISTFTNGPILVGSGTSTGTTSQPLQVTGGAYVSNNLGIGTTNPKSTLSVNGDVSIAGVLTASGGIGTSYYIYESGDISGTYNVVFLGQTGAGNTYKPLQINNGSLTFNPGTNTLTVSTLAGTAANATQINISATSSVDVTTSVVLVGAQTLGAQTPFIDSGLLYNASTNVLTAAGFSGTATNATTAGYATTAGIATVATKLQTERTISLTGDVIGSISFDGSSDVSIAATIQANSIDLGTDTVGDYVQSVSGTSNQITVTGGTGESSTPILSFPNNLVVPQDLTVTRDLSVVRNISASGIITASSFVKFGGTSSEFLKADGSVDTSTYATETYVNNAIVGFITSGSLTGYATQGYVNTQVGLATLGLSSVSYVDTKIGLSTTGLLSSIGDGSSLSGIVTYITAGNGISINQNIGNVTITGTGITSGSNTTYTANNTFSGITTFSGNVVSTGVFQIQQVEETYNSYSTTINSGETVNLDCSTGNTFYITSTVNGNWIANLTNLSLSANCITNVTLMIIQGATPYVPNTLQIGGASQTINWQANVSPTGNASKKDAIAFTIFYTGSAYNVFGQLVTFG